MSADAIRFVLDTDTITYHQRGWIAIISRLTQLDPRQIATTVITMEEQLQGRLAVVRRQQDPTDLPHAYELFERTHAYYCQIPVLPFHEQALVQYRSLLVQRLRIGTQDLRIAAITMANGAILVTSNRRHFGQIGGLQVEDRNAP